MSARSCFPPSIRSSLVLMYASALRLFSPGLNMTGVPLVIVPLFSPLSGPSRLRTRNLGGRSAIAEIAKPAVMAVRGFPVHLLLTRVPLYYHWFSVQDIHLHRRVILHSDIQLRCIKYTENTTTTWFEQDWQRTASSVRCGFWSQRIPRSA